MKISAAWLPLKFELAALPPGGAVY